MKSNHKDSPAIKFRSPIRKRKAVGLIVAALFALNGGRLFGRQQAALLIPSSPGPENAQAKSDGAAPKPAPAPSAPRKLGPFNISVNWRFRTEAWDFFEPSTGQNAYAFEHSLLRIGIGQKTDAFEWLLEGAADGIFDLPPNAVQPAPVGQLGLGGTYYAANGNVRNTASGFLKQAYVGFKLPAKGKVRLGRFTFLDGAEMQPKDKTLATLINTRIAQRLIGDFGFSAVPAEL